MSVLTSNVRCADADASLSPAPVRHRGRPRRVLRAFIGLIFAAALFDPLAASAATSAKHEISANWLGNPANAPFGTAVVGEWHISTNDANDPEANDPVDNVRLTLTATAACRWSARRRA